MPFTNASFMKLTAAFLGKLEVVKKINALCFV
jgi:hypothetical protein